MSKFLYSLVLLLFCVLGVSRYGNTWMALGMILQGLALLSFLLTDLRQWRVSRPLAWACIIISILFGQILYSRPLRETLLGVLLGFSVLACVLVVTTWILRKVKILDLDEFSMGFGDLLLLAAIGGFLGPAKLPLVLFLGSVQGLIGYAFVSFFDRSMAISWESPNFKNHVPFGAFLSLSAFELLIWAR